MHCVWVVLHPETPRYSLNLLAGFSDQTLGAHDEYVSAWQCNACRREKGQYERSFLTCAISASLLYPMLGGYDKRVISKTTPPQSCSGGWYKPFGEKISQFGWKNPLNSSKNRIGLFGAILGSDGTGRKGSNWILWLLRNCFQFSNPQASARHP